MDEIQYIGEHLWIGQLGHFVIVLGFVASLVSAIAYSINVKKEDFKNSWRSLGRIGFWLHGISILVVIGILFYAMYHKYYEYAYVQGHVSDDLPLKYTLSAFWEGQEGSFLLWMFWHILLGFFIIGRGTKWESPVLAVIAMSQVFLNSMLLGVHLEIGDWVMRFGSNPMLLLRETISIPIFNNADYLTLITGNGLNPLLQNYWMTIHPPVTFLGFASTIIPFAFAVAGLWTGQLKEWLKPALPWALFSAAILGSGILMGSVWAYEALSFGGYWAWDPVENAVLVPWLILVAGLHTHLVARATGYSIKATVFFYTLGFPLIVYSTFLTRSGILGDTSVHAFTEMGLETQLISFFAFFGLMGIGGLLYRYKSIPDKKEEEGLASREFWMFIGSLVLLFSSILIGFPTSLPVYNTIRSYFDPNFIGSVIQDPVPFYNKFQVWIGVFMAIISGIAIYLRYNESNFKNRTNRFYRHLGISLGLSLLFTFLLTLWIELFSWQYYLLAFSAFFVMFSNLDYIITVLKGNLKSATSAISHFGFGLMLIGILTSGLNTQTISSNAFLMQGMLNKEDVDKYLVLYKGKQSFGQGYWITYDADTLIGRTRYYDISFEKRDKEENVIESFKVRPTSVYSNDFTTQNVFNPDTRHYWHKDIFTCLVGLDERKMDAEKAQAFEDSLVWDQHVLEIGDTLKTSSDNWYVINGYDFDIEHPEYNESDNDFGVELNLTVGSYRYDTSFQMKTALGLQGALLYKYPDEVQDLGVRARLQDGFVEDILNSEENLNYEKQVFKTYGEVDFKDINIKLVGFNKELENKNYEAEEGDIAVGAQMLITKNGKSYNTEPIFIIRGAAKMDVKAYVPELGLHIRFVDINPNAEEFTFAMAQDNRPSVSRIPIEIAEEINRSDFLVLQATVFPGINLLWLGTVMMMLGLFAAWIIRMRANRLR